MIYTLLYFEFFKIGLFALGGGLATIPFLQELGEKYGWITAQELLDIIAVAESTPGPIGVNAATFVGYKTANILGGIIAVLGLVTPSLIIIIIIAQFLVKFRENTTVRNAFYGIRPTVAGVIGASGVSVMYGVLDGKIYELKIFMMFLLLIFFWAIQKYKKHPIVYIALGACVGVLLRL
ncbi:MAG: chromate transporter [Epulopiscium sp. Nele67-Bin005]|nr:MAG: chromate transporter [Epulopiscium sp. Nele67-Bin005]